MGPWQKVVIVFRVTCLKSLFKKKKKITNYPICPIGIVFPLSVNKNFKFKETNEYECLCKYEKTAAFSLLAFKFHKNIYKNAN